MYKSKLQELCHQNSWVLPEYTAAKDGPDHCPRFTATVTVGGLLFETPKSECKSSKEAQNLVAKIAYNHFTATQPPEDMAPATTSLSAGFLSRISSLDIGPAKHDELQQKQGEHAQTSLAQEPPFGHNNESRPKDTLHLYKNRLQHHSQKKNINLPEYSCEFDGPPHARQFRASVTIEGRTYRSPEYFSTLKDAEHAAAKVAFESLSLDEIQEDEGLYKTLLQEVAQKQGLCFPSYSTMKTGSSHMPTFVSTVEVGGEIFQGTECKTKKQSETNAARFAYDGLMERIKTHTFSPRDDTKGKTQVTPVSLEPAISGGLQPNTGVYIAIEAPVELSAGEIHRNSSVRCPGSHRNEATKVSCSSSSLDAVGAYDLQQDVLVTHIEIDGEDKGNEMNAKRHRYSALPENMPGLPKTFPPTSPSSNGSPSRSVWSEHTAYWSVESDDEKPDEYFGRPGSKILVYPSGSPMTIPQGASILPCSDANWMAVKVEMNQDQRMYP